MHRISLLVAASAAAIAAAAGSAQASGFQLNERSAKAIGSALSGSVSAASDVTYAGFNPAALSTVESIEVGGSLNAVAPIAEGTVALNGQEVDADNAALLPSFAAGYRLSEDLVIGVTSYSPFGLVTDYERDFVGRAEADKSRLTAVQVSPTVAWQPIDRLTVGASLDVLYADARLTSAAVALEGDSFDFSFSAGLLAEPVDGTRIGLAYHHGYDLTLEGENRILVLPGEPTFATEASASLPPLVQLGITQQVTPRLRLSAEGRWIGWEDFDSIDISTPDAPDLTPLMGPNFQELEERQDYENAWFAAIGAEYDVNERLTLRSGVAYDQTPTTDESRTPRVPDEDRLWLALGGSYAVTDRLTMDAGYAYLHALDDATVQLETPATEIEYDGGAHILSIGGAMRF